MASLEECKNFVRPPGQEEEEVAVCDPRWGPLDNEDLGYLIRRIDFQKIIDFHTKDLMHKLVKSESITKKLKDTVTGLQGELKVKEQKIADLERRVATSIDHTEERLEMIETKQALIIQQIETKLQVEEVSDGDDGEKLQTIENRVEEVNERLVITETKLEELVSENEGNLQAHQHQDIFAREIREVEKNIIIKNLPMVSSTEEQKDTTTLVKDVFKQVRLPSSVKFSAKRIFNTKKEAKPGRNGRKGWPPIIHVTFKSSDTKKELFQQLQHLKGSKFEKLSIQNEYPPCVRHQARVAELKAAEHRKKFPGTKTKLSLNNGNPIILVKSSSSSKYVPLEE